MGYKSPADILTMAATSAASAIRVTGTALEIYTSLAASVHTASAASSAQRFPDNTCVAVAVKALPSNTGNIWIGGSTVSNTIGFVLDAGEAIALKVDNTNLIYYWADTVSDKVCWIIIN